MKEMNGRVNFWAPFMNFGGNPTCSNIKVKTSSGAFNGFASYSKIISDLPEFFINYFVGGFQIPIFVVIDPSTKKAVSITGNNDYGGYNPQRAFSDAKAAVTALLSTGAMDERKSAAPAGGFRIAVTKRIIAVDNPSGMKADLTLVNSAGRTVAHARTSSRKASLSLSGISSGVYVLKCDGEKQCASYRMFIR